MTKLLSKAEARSKVKKENDYLITENIRLRGLHKEIIAKLNTAKLNYDPEKMKALEDFENFKRDLAEKKSKLLKELKDVEDLIEQKKDLYYGLIAKQDELDEKLELIRVEGIKLEDRRNFVEGLEKSWREKNG